MKIESVSKLSTNVGLLIRILQKMSRRNLFILLYICFGTYYLALFSANTELMMQYQALESVTVQDRNGQIISITPNSKGEYTSYLSNLPARFKKLLVTKEDRFFYFHSGYNPASIARALSRLLFYKSPRGSSTITEQLAKNLLANEQNRNLVNKFKELFYAIALEKFHSKKEILLMYANSVYMGSNIQGFEQASLNYFDKKLSNLNDSEIVSLLATLASPNASNPRKIANEKIAQKLATKLGVHFEGVTSVSLANKFFLNKSKTSFELETLGVRCEASCATTLDVQLNEKIREILKRNIEAIHASGARNGAIIVLKEPENELLAIVGSVTPENPNEGQNINMAIEPRPIGSTAKPFIYAKAFEMGLRPYTEVVDREYKYGIATGYSLYPKNYDGLYHGTVTLHESLSNSYNVPTVKTLEYVGLSEFYNFLEHKLNFKPLRNLDSYQYGIALGGLEMDTLTLAEFYSIFPARGVLKPLTLYKNSVSNFEVPMSRVIANQKVIDSKYIELVTRILNDRKTGVEQFGLASSLNLTQDNYAVKTGTSRNYHDSWTVGYTPDYVVVVWLGNAENEPLKRVSGQSGAGQIWNEVMELLGTTEYNKKTPFSWTETKEFLIDGSLDFGLPDDQVNEKKFILREKSLITSPHDGDVILIKQGNGLKLKASTEAVWFVDGKYIGRGILQNFIPMEPGEYTIKAENTSKSESIKISVDFETI